MMHQTAKGLASLGRNGDTMLMHVNPNEVAGLQKLGNMIGRKVTTNPHTGMPEAFSFGDFDFGDFMTSILPMAGGLLLAPGTGGASLVASTLGQTAAAAAPIVVGGGIGAGIAAAKGENVLLGGGLGALGGWTGGNLGETFGKMGAGSVTSAGGAPIENAIAATPIDATQLSQQIGGANLASTGAGATAATNLGAGYDNILAGIKKLPTEGVKGFTDAGGSKMGLYGAGISPIMAGYKDALLPQYKAPEEDKDKYKYIDPNTGKLTLAASPGLNLGVANLATGGTVNTNSSTISSGGIQDLYGTNDQTTGTQNLSKDGYGIGRLNTLAAEGSRAKAADTFYAMGGPVAFANGGIFDLEAAKGGYLDGHGDGMSDSIPGTIEGKQPARLADGEFVIPADVVSHLGNGSSKAGAKRLYSMMAKIRRARTGNSKQGKQINPNKYMPA
jgi:hypothetical protein